MGKWTRSVLSCFDEVRREFIRSREGEKTVAKILRCFTFDGFPSIQWLGGKFSRSREGAESVAKILFKLR